MSQWRTGYWKSFNCVGRAIGFGFLVVGTIIGFWGITLVISNNQAYDKIERWLIALVPLGVAVLGWLVVKAKPYRPDLRPDRDEDRAH